MVQYFTNTVKLYSTSLFSYSIDNKILDNVAKDCANLANLFAQNSALLKNASAPIYSEIKQQEILGVAISALNCAKETVNFIFLLARNKRLSLLDKIIAHFILLYKNHLGKKLIEVTSSYAMSEKEIQELQKKLEQIYSAEIELTLKQDPEILGGLIIKQNNQMLDASLKTKFENLTNMVAQEIALL